MGAITSGPPIGGRVLALLLLAPLTPRQRCGARPAGAAPSDSGGRPHPVRHTPSEALLPLHRDARILNAKRTSLLFGAILCALVLGGIALFAGSNRAWENTHNCPFDRQTQADPGRPRQRGSFQRGHGPGGPWAGTG